jgi:putative copper export protein
VSADLLSVIVRTLAFICLFQAAGVAFFLLLFGVWLARSDRAIKRLGFFTALAAIPLLAAHQGLDAARMADGLSGLADTHLQYLAWHSGGGNAAVLEMIGLGVIALGLASDAARTADIASIGALIATCAAVLTGHTSVHAERPLLALLLALHLVLVAFWFGALLPLILCSLYESQQATVAVLREFSAIAGPLVPCIAIAGLTMALVLMPDRTAWGTAYGSLVLTKIIAFAGLMLLAAWNRWRALPKIESSHAAAPERAIRVSIATEYGLIVGVLSVTAVLTTFYSP